MRTVNSVNLLIGGAAGQGIDTMVYVLERSLMRTGYHSFTLRDYMSRVRGGHNFMQVRFGSAPVHTHDETPDLILCLNPETETLHRDALRPGGLIVTEGPAADSVPGRLSLPVKATTAAVGNPRTAGTVWLGALMHLLDLPLAPAEAMLSQIFGNSMLGQFNLKALAAGYALTSPQLRVPLPEAAAAPRMLISGNEALAFGALAAGMNFYVAYPMTPSTSIMTFLTRHTHATRTLVEQAEDEISAVHMAIGASFAGARAMTGTSGGGFSLMVEALGFAGIAEIPLVVADIQRPGPATGLPTRTEQSDLRFVVSASHGEFPRMVMALRDPADAYTQTQRAFRIAEDLQLPVILLGDQYLADSTVTLPAFSLPETPPPLPGARTFEGAGEDYRRYALTPEGISPRLIPGDIPGALVTADSDEHEDTGLITESSATRIAQMDKRMNKMKRLEALLEEPAYTGADNPETVLLTWGSTGVIAREAVETLVSRGEPVGMLCFGDIWPLPAATLHKLALSVKHWVAVEQNATGQLASLVREVTGIEAGTRILKYDGRPFSPDEIIRRLKGADA